MASNTRARSDVAPAVSATRDVTAVTTPAGRATVASIVLATGTASDDVTAHASDMQVCNNDSNEHHYFFNFV